MIYKNYRGPGGMLLFLLQIFQMDTYTVECIVEAEYKKVHLRLHFQQNFLFVFFEIFNGKVKHLMQSI